MNPSNPFITVLLCTYNDEAFIAETIQSILDQTYNNFEFIILNDGSSDGTKDIIHSFTDQRIRYLEHDVNKGLEDAKNWGLDEAKGKYIAYIDGDDLSEPDRLRLQVEYMEAHPETGICSTCKILFGLKNKTLEHIEHDLEIRARALFGTPMEHPSCMVRTEVLRKHNIKYRKNFPIAEDYPFMVDMMVVSQAYCVQIPLIKKRIHDQRISVTKKEIQNESAARASQMAFEVLLGIRDAGAKERLAARRCFSSKIEFEDIAILEKICDNIKMDEELSNRDIEYRRYIKNSMSKSIHDLIQKNEKVDNTTKNHKKTKIGKNVKQSFFNRFISIPFRSIIEGSKNGPPKKIAPNHKLPVLGVVITQKNEAALLNHNIEYHRYMGISHFYIFDDGSTDRSMDTVPDAEDVHKYYGTDYSNISVEMETVKQKALDGNWMGRQILNTYNALKLAKEDGVDWLFFIDTDELVFFGSEEESSFRKEFAKVESDIDVVHFNTVYEAVQNLGETDNIFRSVDYFKTHKYNREYERKMLDPFINKKVTLKGFLGHKNGKQAARISADLLPVSAHRFKKRDGTIPSKQDMGQLMHFHSCSFQEFMKQNSIPHPSHFVYGKKVNYYPKMLWKDLVIKSGMTREELHSYYKQWVEFSDEEISRLLEQSKNDNPLIVEVNAIKRIWNKITNDVKSKIVIGK